MDEKKIYQTKSNQKRAGKAILTSDKIYFKTEIVTRNKEGQFILIEVLIYQEDIKMINIYAPNNKALKYKKQKQAELKGEINNSSIMVGDFNTSL